MPGSVVLTGPCFLFPRLLETGPGLRAPPADPLRQSQATSIPKGQNHAFSRLLGPQLQLELEWWEREGHLQFRSGADGGTSLGEGWDSAEVSCLTSHTHPTWDQPFLATTP